MAKFTVTFEVDDEDLESAIKFLKATDDNIEPLIKEYYTGKKHFNLSLIPKLQERYYHTNGLCAMIMVIQEAIPKT